MPTERLLMRQKRQEKKAKPKITSRSTKCKGFICEKKTQNHAEKEGTAGSDAPKINVGETEKRRMR